MPPPPNYDCPVCKKGFQRGYLAKHIRTHSQYELVAVVTNKDDVRTKSAHPHFDCSGHTYIICPYTKDAGFELGTRLHKDHVCNFTYSDWLISPVPEIIPVKNTIITPEDESEGIKIHMILPEDEIITDKQCDCHIEIAQLNDELEKLTAWKNLILSSLPKASEPKATEPKEAEPKTEPKNKRKASKKPTIIASKKEIEKGMWCSSCAACGTTAQFTTDLRPCSSCKRLTHYNDDLTNCYHWDCIVCDKKTCYTCVKQAGGNKMKPLCSVACTKIHRQSL
jgi:hypothetical protein